MLTSQLRSLLISTAGINGHQKVINEAKDRFKAYFSGDEEAIHPNLRSAIFGIVILHSGEGEYE